MQATALVSFAAMVDGQMVSVRAGEVIVLPAGVDWVRAGLVAPMPEPVEVAVDPLPGVEHAVTRKRRATA